MPPESDQESHSVVPGLRNLCGLAGGSRWEIARRRLQMSEAYNSFDLSNSGRDELNCGNFLCG